MPLIPILLGLMQNHDKTNHKGRKGHKGIRVSESSCVSPVCIKIEGGALDRRVMGIRWEQRKEVKSGSIFSYTARLISASPKVLSAILQRILWETAESSYYVKLKLKSKSTTQNADSN